MQTTKGSIDELMQMLAFRCGNVRYALDLTWVIRTFLNADAIPLPGASECVRGALAIGRQVVPVIDFCRLSDVAPRVSLLWQRLILVQLQQERVCLLVDTVDGVIEQPAEAAVAVSPRVQKAPYIQGVLRLTDGLHVIVQPDQLIDPRQRDRLRGALASLAAQVSGGGH